MTNGTQSVFLSNLKLLCIQAGIMIAAHNLFGKSGDELVDSAGNVTTDCLGGAAR
jgi:hypothetical protein